MTSSPRLISRSRNSWFAARRSASLILSQIFGGMLKRRAPSSLSPCTPGSARRRSFPASRHHNNPPRGVPGGPASPDWRPRPGTGRPLPGGCPGPGAVVGLAFLLRAHAPALGVVEMAAHHLPGGLADHLGQTAPGVEAQLPAGICSRVQLWITMQSLAVPARRRSPRTQSSSRTRTW